MIITHQKTTEHEAFDNLWNVTHKLQLVSPLLKASAIISGLNFSAICRCVGVKYPIVHTITAFYSHLYRTMHHTNINFCYFLAQEISK